MRDRPTDSWWSIMTGVAIGGELEGTPLKEIAVSEKTQWGEWKRRYPTSKVWSIGGMEHDDTNPYDHYLGNTKTFRESKTPDKRLPDKESVYAFQMDGVTYAVPHALIFGGAVLQRFTRPRSRMCQTLMERRVGSSSMMMDGWIHDHR